MAQDHGVVVAEIAHQPLALAEIEGDAFTEGVGGSSPSLPTIAGMYITNFARLWG